MSNSEKSKIDPEKMIELTKTMVVQYKYYILLFMVIGVIVVLLFYISYKFGLKPQNCKTIEKNATVINITEIDKSYNQPVSNYFIKTAYNCFCSGNFKNDYVDVCALQNCAKYGVRALDFQIYSLNNNPIISASTVISTQYKEIYNYIPFYDGMNNVKKFFINNNTTNITDPLFLIFRLYTTNSAVYDMMGDTLNEIFGYASNMGNMIYIIPPNQTLDEIVLNSLIGQVIIIVDATNGDPAKFNSSKLHLYTTFTLGTQTNKIYRENDVLNSMTLYPKLLIDSSNNLNILYPNLEYSNSNYDFVTTGINNGISFIGMNFQKNDTYLTEYNTVFNNFAFIPKTETIATLCQNPLYYSMPNCPKTN